jgi:hypothetical protein
MCDIFNEGTNDTSSACKRCCIRPDIGVEEREDHPKSPKNCFGV